MKIKIILLCLCLIGCSPVETPDSFVRKDLETTNYTLATWQKDQNPNAPVRIYIEGDGHSFNHLGLPTQNPTPRSDFLRKLAFNDPNPNVVYMARPCQYVEDERCFVSDWTTGRFSKAVVDSMGEAVRMVSKNRPIILIGYSGGAMISAFVITRNPELKVQKWITIAGVLDHEKWTKLLKVRPLVDSLDLKWWPQVPQVHFVGEKDTVVPPELTQSIVPYGTMSVVPRAGHASGFEIIESLLYQ